MDGAPEFSSLVVRRSPWTTNKAAVRKRRRGFQGVEQVPLGEIMSPNLGYPPECGKRENRGADLERAG